jgi:hypothetical protein
MFASGVILITVASYSFYSTGYITGSGNYRFLSVGQYIDHGVALSYHGVTLFLKQRI